MDWEALAPPKETGRFWEILLHSQCRKILEGVPLERGEGCTWTERGRQIPR